LRIERRKVKRYSTGSKCRGRIIFLEDIIIKNISDTGMCIETNQPINTNRIYKIQLLPKEDKEAMIKVEVAWAMLRGTRKEKNDLLPVYEVGLKFTEMNEDEKKYLEDLISRISINPESP
jgi:hypothetical protein